MFVGNEHVRNSKRVVLIIKTRSSSIVLSLNQKISGKFLALDKQHLRNSFMSPPNFEKIAAKVFPELEGDLVPYVASILEENKTATADELVEVLSPILTGYEVCSEEAIAERCKKLPGMMHHKEEVKK